MCYEFNYKMYDLFDALESCRNVAQMEKHHPEGDVFTHSVQALEIAMRESDDLDLIFAAMLHDVGKKIDTKGHEQYALEMLKDKRDTNPPKKHTNIPL